MTDQQSRLVPLIMRFVLVASVVGVLALWFLNREPQAPNDVHIAEETGHSIRGAFWTFYNNNGGLAVFGYPITEQFTHAGKSIQYFQNVRMELATDGSGSVRLSPIAVQMGKEQPPIAPPTQSALLQRYFSETGHLIDERFYDYFLSRGGVGILGYPIAEAATEANRVVQYFENVKLEWHPELQDQPVSLSALGEAHFYAVGIPSGLDVTVLQQRSPAGFDLQTPTDTITTLDIDATVDQTHTTYPGTQTVTVFVAWVNTDTGRQPSSGAHVHLSIRYPDTSASQEFDMPPTDIQGRTSLTFDILPSPIREKIVVLVTAQAANETRQTELSFIRWP